MCLPFAVKITMIMAGAVKTVLTRISHKAPQHLNKALASLEKNRMIKIKY